eukprot:m.174427 g.174427  ORF g.174427 m.174427 type:complete len:1780 (+) comp13506_c0_seq1:12-5351(+)
MSVVGGDKQLLDGLETDLNSLATAAKKSPALRMKAEAALVRMKGHSFRNTVNTAQALAEHGKDIMQTFSMGCEEIKSPKIIAASVSGILRLVQNNAVAPETFDIVLDRLESLVTAMVESIKVLQCVLSLVTTTPFLIDEKLARAFVICLQLHAHAQSSSSRDMVTASVAAATLRQITTASFDRVINEDKEREQGASSSVNASDGFMLFQDLCLLTSGEVPIWLKGVRSIPRQLGLELIESALQSHPILFFNHKPYATLLQKRVCSLAMKIISPTVVGSGKGNVPQFSETIRVLRILKSVILQYHNLVGTEVTIFLNLINKFLQKEQFLWQRAAFLEVVCEVFRDPKVLVFFFSSPVMHTQAVDIFTNLTTSIMEFVDELLHTQQALPLTSTASQQTMFLCLMDRSEPPQMQMTYTLSLCFSTCIALVKSLSSLVQPRHRSSKSDDNDVFEESEGGSDGNGGVVVSFSDDQHRAKLLFECVWSPLLSSLQKLLAVSSIEAVTETILRALQSAIRVCGTLHLRHQRDAFLTILCSECLPSNFSWSNNSSPATWEINSKHVQCVHILLNSALCMGEMMNQSWEIIVSMLQQLVALFDLSGSGVGHTRKHIRSSSNSSSQKKHRRTSSATTLSLTSSSASELPALEVMMSQLFEITPTFSDSALGHFISALCHQSESTLDQIATAALHHPLFKHNAYLFPVKKLLQVCKGNLHRIMVFWPIVTAHLIEVSCNNNSELRQLGVKTLTSLVHAALTYPRKQHLEQLPGLQQAILSPLRNLASCAYVDVRLAQLECVKKVLDSTGQSLAHAWPVMIGIVSDTTSGNVAVHDARVIALAFESLQMIVQDFLPAVPVRCLPLLLQTISNFCTQEDALNVALTAVGLVWNIADHISKNEILLEEKLALRREKDSVSHISSSNNNSQQTPKLKALGVEPQTRENAQARAQEQDHSSSSPPPPLFSGSSFLADPSDNLLVRQVVDSDGLPRHVTVVGLWRTIYRDMGALCLDARGGVRRCACQTFFPMLKKHIGLLSGDNLLEVMGKNILSTIEMTILFGKEGGREVVLSQLKKASSNRKHVDGNHGTEGKSSTTSSRGGNTRTRPTHHSTDDASMWDETKSMCLQGCVQVLSLSAPRVAREAKFTIIWKRLLGCVEELCADTNPTIAFAAASCFQVLFSTCHSSSDALHRANHHISEVKEVLGEHREGLQREKSSGESVASEDDIARLLWMVLHGWLDVCSNVLLAEKRQKEKVLIALAKHVLSFVTSHHSHLTVTDATRVAEALVRIFCAQPSDVYYSPRVNDVQESVVSSLRSLAPSASHPHLDNRFVPTLLRCLVQCVECAVTPPWRVRDRNCFIAGGMLCVDTFVETLGGYCEDRCVVYGGVCGPFLSAILPILDARYAGESLELWVKCMSASVSVIDFGLRGLAAVSTQHQDDALNPITVSLWDVVEKTIGACLFPSHPRAFCFDKKTISADMLKEHEELDVAAVKLVRDTILPITSSTSSRGSSRAGVDVPVPPQTLRNITSILKRGSVNTLRQQQSQQHKDNQSDGNGGRIEEDSNDGEKCSTLVRASLAHACFEALVTSSDRPKEKVDSSNNNHNSTSSNGENNKDNTARITSATNAVTLKPNTIMFEKEDTSSTSFLGWEFSSPHSYQSLSQQDEAQVVTSLDNKMGEVDDEGEDGEFSVRGMAIECVNTLSQHCDRVDIHQQQQQQKKETLLSEQDENEILFAIKACENLVCMKHREVATELLYPALVRVVATPFHNQRVLNAVAQILKQFHTSGLMIRN